MCDWQGQSRTGADGGLCPQPGRPHTGEIDAPHSPNKTGLTASVATRRTVRKGISPEMTTTLNLEVYRILADEMTRRKLAKRPNGQLLAVLGEAMVLYPER